MVNKKSILFVITTLILSITILVNCSDSTSNDEEDLVGTWNLIKITYETLGQTETQYPADLGYTMTLIIRNDNTYSRIQTVLSISDSTHGTWSISGKNLNYTEGDEDFQVGYKLNGDKFEVIRNINESIVTVTETQEFRRQ